MTNWSGMGFTSYEQATEAGKTISVLAELTRRLKHVVGEKCGHNWPQILGLPITSCVIWNKLLNFSELQFSPL